MYYFLRNKRQLSTDRRGGIFMEDLFGASPPPPPPPGPPLFVRTEATRGVSQAGDRMEGQASAHGHSAPVTLQCKPVGGTSGAGGGGPIDDGGAPRELEITTTSASMPVLIQAHNAVLRRARELSTAAARSPGGAPQQASGTA